MSRLETVTTTVLRSPLRAGYGSSVASATVPGLTSTVLTALTKLTDHLPIVADYSVVGVNPLPTIWLGGTDAWSNAAKWSTGIVPNSSTVVVEIDNGNPTASIVTLDQTASVAQLTLDANDTLIIGGGNGLTLVGPSASALNGTLTNNGTFTAGTVTSSGTFTQNGTLNQSGTFTNTGTATFGGTQNWSAAATFTNSLGSAHFQTDSGAAAANLNVNITGGSVMFSSTQHLASLSIGSSGAASVATAASPSVRSVIVTGSLSNSGLLDLTNNDLIVHNGSLAGITTQIATGYNGGNWQGTTGITSSTAQSTGNTALGIILNDDGSGNPLLSTFDGESVSTGDVLVKYTYFGDANLDGVVNGSDYTLIDNGFNNSLTGWNNGDFNYDGVINGDDYTLIDNSFNTQGASLAGIPPQSGGLIGAQETAQLNSTTVPEPIGFGGIVFAAIGLISRRSRRKNFCAGSNADKSMRLARR